MKTVKVFEVMGHTDTAEGRGPMKVVARFSNQTAAAEFVTSPAYSQYCVMGYQSIADLANIHETDLIIFDTINEVHEMMREELRASAIAKLSKAEREALGLQ